MISSALQDVINQLGDILIKGLGVLLPDVYRLFLFLAVQHSTEKIREVEVREQFSKVTLLGYVIGYFGKHLAWECQQKSCGILLYRTGANLVLALSKTLKCLQLANMSLLKISISTADLEIKDSHSPNDTEDQEDAKLTLVLSDLNKRIHDQIKMTTSKDATTPYDISSFNLEDCIRNIDPVLWKMVVLLTRSVRGSRRNKPLSRQRKLQCLYTLCVMLFNTNRSCSSPMHVLLTDIIEAHGGSTELICTLNHVGAIASLDTHKRYAQFVIEKKLEGLLSGLDENLFRVVSVDNIDFLQRHAFVYCGDQKRSWHGTTIQVTQPMVCENITVDDEGESPMLSQHESSTCTSQSSVEDLSSNQTCSTTSNPPTTDFPSCKKVCCRSRTSTEANSTHYFVPSSPERDTTSSQEQNTMTSHSLQRLSHNHYSPFSNRSLADFQITTTQDKELKKFKSATLLYMLLASQTKDSTFIPVLSKIFPHSPMQSKFVYLNVLDQNADSQETIHDVISRLYQEFHIGETTQYLLVAGDAKTYVHLQNLKLDYGEKLSWLIPFPGDLHILMNFQPILQKIYFDAGLKQIALACGYRAETLTSLQNSSHFKRSHYFLLQAWEATYCLMVDTFLASNQHMLRTVRELQQLRKTSGWQQAFKEGKDRVDKIEEEFMTFVQSKGKTDPNWEFWADFVTTNCFSYIALYCAIRSGNWSLRLGSIKLMAPLFCAFDRTTYRCLIPQHLADCLLHPQSIEENLVAGGFSVSITCKPWKSVALDEAHEMMINKDCKMAVIHPNKEFVRRMARYFPFRSKVMHNFNTQTLSKKAFLDDLHSSSKDHKMKANIETMKKAIHESKTLSSNTTGELLKLRNAFTSTLTTTQQQDLLTFRDVGKKHFNAYVQKVYLKKNSKEKLKFHKLKTFSTQTKVTKRNYNQLQKEKDHVTKCLKRRLLSHSREEIRGSDEQYLELPRAIADPDGIPHKGTKSSTTAFYLQRYGEEVILSSFPQDWLPDTVILEGMFMINTPPLRIHRCMGDC